MTARQDVDVRRHEDMQHQSSDMARVHERIDALAKEIHDDISEVTRNQIESIKTVGALTASVRESVALCGTCRPVVVGNGKQSMDSRMVLLEDFKRQAKAFFWVLCGTLGTVSGYGIWYWLKIAFDRVQNG